MLNFCWIVIIFQLIKTQLFRKTPHLQNKLKIRGGRNLDLELWISTRAITHFYWDFALVAFSLKQASSRIVLWQLFTAGQVGHSAVWQIRLFWSQNYRLFWRLDTCYWQFSKCWMKRSFKVALLSTFGIYVQRKSLKLQSMLRKQVPKTSSLNSKKCQNL